MMIRIVMMKFNLIKQTFFSLSFELMAVLLVIFLFCLPLIFSFSFPLEHVPYVVVVYLQLHLLFRTITISCCVSIFMIMRCCRWWWYCMMLMIVLKYASPSALDGRNQNGTLWGWFKMVFNLIHLNALASPPISPNESDWEHPGAVGEGVVFAFQFEFITFA